MAIESVPLEIALYPKETDFDPVALAISPIDTELAPDA